MEMEQFPMDPQAIAKCQLRDGQIKQSNEELEEEKLQGIKLMTTKDGEICTPTKLRQRTVAWHHLCLRHPGSTRLEKNLRIAHWRPDLRKDIEVHTQHCHQCQKRKSHGKTPPKEAEPPMP